MTAPFPAAAFDDRFEVVEEFRGGEGQSALVALRGTGERLVAKVLHGDALPAEASLLASLRHPAIPAIREVGRLPDGRAFLLREYAPGRTLAESLPLPPERALRVARQILEVLAFVHLRGILHLDLKPQNLVLTGDDDVRLLDFGLAVRTGRGAAGGTPFFAAPELLLGATPDARSDLFSLGAVLVACLWPRAGKLPLARFLQLFPQQTFWAACSVDPQDFPAPFPQFLERCVARRPQKRFADAQSALEFLVGGTGRPKPGLLQPDVVAWFGDDLLACARAARGDVRIEDGTAAEREQLGLHLLCSLPGFTGLQREDAALRVVRAGGAAPVPWRLPEPSAGQVAEFLHGAANLPLDAARAAVAQLGARGRSAAALGQHLLELADRGEIVPDGTRWSWPAAAQGRLRAANIGATSRTADPAGVLAAIRGGQLDTALGLYTRCPAMQPDQDRSLRRELSRALLQGGEPARALPLCGGDLPVERAQALFELGRADDAAQALGTARAAVAGDPAASRRLLRTETLLRAARGGAGAALAEWTTAITAAPTDEELQTSAVLLETLGRTAEARALLLELEQRLRGDSATFLRAAVLTSLGHAERRLGDLEAARARFTAARELLFRLGHARHAATALHNLGLVLKDQRRFDDAVEHLRQARTLFQHTGDLTSAAISEASLGSTALAAGDPVAAEKHLAPAIQDLRRLGSRGPAQHALVLLARALVEQGRSAEAIAILLELDPEPTAQVRSETEQVRALLKAGTVPGRTSPPGATAAPPAPIPPVPVSEPQSPSRELFRTFLAVNRRLAQESDLEKAMTYLLEAAVMLTAGRTGFLLVARPDGLRREVQSGEPGPSGQAFSRSLAHRAMQLRRTLTGDEALAERDLQEMPSIKNLQIRSAICAPFHTVTGAEGAIYVEHPGRAGAFTDDDKQGLEVLADQAAIAVDRMLREERLAAELEQSRRELAVVQRTSRRETGRLIGDSPVMQGLRMQIEKLAQHDLPVLVLGETGTGKELVARAIHDSGPRRKRPFVAENCSALPPELMERELFGHVQGAFTGADQDRPGLLELANEGTLFLDEVGDMPPALQVKLLRALQEQAIRRVGGSDTIPLDLRLLAATHKDLRAMVQRGEFREDLFFRLAAMELRVPPLRERQGDVAVLSRHFLERLCRQHGVVRRFAADAEAALLAYHWPGNVRELEHVVARAFLLAEGDTISAVDVPVRPMTAPATADQPATAPATAPRELTEAQWPVLTLEEAERRTVLAALRACGGDKTKAAKTLEISRTALYEKLKRYAADP